MGVDRQGSKSGGGYVGGFLHLFDWNAKSRKKLFSGKSDLPERSKQKKTNDGNYPMTRLHLMDQDEVLAGSSIKGSSDYSCASSVTDDEVGGSKAPGVVAKLMGLDSLPTSNFSEAYSTPFFDSQSLRDAHYHRKTLEFHHDHQIMHSGNLLNEAENPVRNNIETKPQKMISRPIEKFQTEILPPKSAKSIPITHHKLLSPIKSPGFIPSKDVVHIMEAAAKIIESGNQVNTRAKMPLVGSSVPLKVKDLKDKIEAVKKPSRLSESSRKPVESIETKHLKGQPMNKSWNGSLDSKSFRVSSDLKDISAGLKSKGKSISLAVQAKVNVQKREGLNLSGNKSLFSQKEQSDMMARELNKNQPKTQRSSHKKPSTNNAPSVLRQNNQKQNSLAERGKLPSKTLASINSQGRKELPGDSSIGQQRNSSKCSSNSKIGSRKLGLEATDNRKESPYSSTSTTRKKRCIDGDFHFEKNTMVDKIDTNGNASPYNAQMDRKFDWTEDSRRTGMDVVSFTFTAPMARSVPVSETSKEFIEKNNAFCEDFRDKMALLNSGGTKALRLSSRNVIGGDALSTLLEQKLRELTLGVESSRHKAGIAGRSASIFQGMTSPLHDERSGKRSDKDNLDPAFSSTNSEGLIRKHKLLGADEISECGSNDTELRKLLDCRHPSPISVLEPSFFTESCNSSDTTDTISNEGSKQCLSVLAQEVFDVRYSKKSHLMEADAELSDSASSSSTRTVAGKHVTDSAGSTIWELEYVKEILCNTEMMYKDFACGRTREIISPHLYDQLESRKAALDSGGDEPRLRSKALFDCTRECLDLRCRQYVGGGYRAWAKGLSVVRRRELLAEEVYREISGWEAMGDCMVDELVDKDMSSISTQGGKWLDFDIEAFELGVEIEGRILNSLVNEAIADILLL